MKQRTSAIYYFCQQWADKQRHFSHDTAAARRRTPVRLERHTTNSTAFTSSSAVVFRSHSLQALFLRKKVGGDPQHLHIQTDPPPKKANLGLAPSRASCQVSFPLPHSALNSQLTRNCDNVQGLVYARVSSARTVMPKVRRDDLRSSSPCRHVMEYK